MNSKLKIKYNNEVLEIGGDELPEVPDNLGKYSLTANVESGGKIIDWEERLAEELPVYRFNQTEGFTPDQPVQEVFALDVLQGVNCEALGWTITPNVWRGIAHYADNDDWVMFKIDYTEVPPDPGQYDYNELKLLKDIYVPTQVSESLSGQTTRSLVANTQSLIWLMHKNFNDEVASVSIESGQVRMFAQGTDITLTRETALLNMAGDDLVNIEPKQILTKQMADALYTGGGTVFPPGTARHFIVRKTDTEFEDSQMTVDELVTFQSGTIIGTNKVMIGSGSTRNSDIESSNLNINDIATQNMLQSAVESLVPINSTDGEITGQINNNKRETSRFTLSNTATETTVGVGMEVGDLMLFYEGIGQTSGGGDIFNKLIIDDNDVAIAFDPPRTYLADYSVMTKSDTDHAIATAIANIPGGGGTVEHNQSLTGTGDTASPLAVVYAPKLQTARTINSGLNSDVAITTNPTFDGTGDINLINAVAMVNGNAVQGNALLGQGNWAYKQILQRHEDALALFLRSQGGVWEIYDQIAFSDLNQCPAFQSLASSNAKLTFSREGQFFEGLLELHFTINGIGNALTSPGNDQAVWDIENSFNGGWKQMFQDWGCNITSWYQQSVSSLTNGLFISGLPNLAGGVLMEEGYVIFDYYHGDPINVSAKHQLIIKARVAGNFTLTSSYSFYRRHS